MIRLIVGLGNPGKQYENTRHNIGFDVVDTLARESNTDFRSEQKFQAELAKVGDLLIAKPQTFMNKSGESVSRLKEFFKIENDQIIVICDDINLQIGQIRVRQEGSSGGHNGLDSVISHIGDSFWRVRVGVGINEVGDSADHVLKKYNPEEQKIFAHTVDESVKLMLELISSEKLESKTINLN